MPKKLDPKVEGMIIAFSKDKLSSREIETRLRDQKITVSYRTVLRVIKNIGKRRQAKAVGLPSPVKVQPVKVMNSKFLKKVKIMISKENPPSQFEMARKLKASRRTVQRAIRRLGQQKRKKTRVHRLLPRHKANRTTNCRRLYEKVLAGKRSEFVVTLDEAMFGLHDSNGKRKVCYVKRGEQVPESWVVESDQFHNSFMVVGIMSGRGTLPLVRVPKKVKVNGDWYIKYVLKPLVEKHIPKVYGADMSKVTIHHDAATSHTCKKVEAYAAEVERKWGIKIIKKSHIPIKSPDASPLDFFGFGYLKRRVYLKKPKSIKGLWKLLQSEWSKVDQNLVERTYESWKRRLRMIASGMGNHIENSRKIHNRSR